MKTHNIKLSLPLLLLFSIACTNNQEVQTGDKQEREPVFPIGEQIDSENFTGSPWLQMLVVDDGTLDTHIGNVTFEPGARTNWHYHPGGQILMATYGTGYYQERGQPFQIMQEGDVIVCPPDVEHWHGASPDSKFTHIAISPNLDRGGVVWLDPVTDEEYSQPVE
jgi:quercetin dioxygenase-like cupin family protein